MNKQSLSFVSLIYLSLQAIILILAVVHCSNCFRLAPTIRRHIGMRLVVAIIVYLRSSAPLYVCVYHVTLGYQLKVLGLHFLQNQFNVCNWLCFISTYLPPLEFDTLVGRILEVKVLMTKNTGLFWIIKYTNLPTANDSKTVFRWKKSVYFLFLR